MTTTNTTTEIDDPIGEHLESCDIPHCYVCHPHTAPSEMLRFNMYWMQPALCCNRPRIVCRENPCDSPKPSGTNWIPVTETPEDLHWNADYGCNASDTFLLWDDNEQTYTPGFCLIAPAGPVWFARGGRSTGFERFTHYAKIAGPHADVINQHDDIEF